MKKGFTIIEMLIVIVVIAILVGIALPRFRGMQEEGLIAQAKGELRTIQTALESYYIHYSSVYPADGALTNVEGATPNIVSDVPGDPFNVGNDYGYNLSANGNYYVVYSKGTDGTSAAISDAGAVTETGGTSVIWVSNGGQDSYP